MSEPKRKSPNALQGPAVSRGHGEREQEERSAHRSGDSEGKVALFAGLDWILSAPRRTNWPTAAANLWGGSEGGCEDALRKRERGERETRGAPSDEGVEGEVCDGEAVDKLNDARQDEEEHEAVDEFEFGRG